MKFSKLAHFTLCLYSIAQCTCMLYCCNVWLVYFRRDKVLIMGTENFWRVEILVHSLKWTSSKHYHSAAHRWWRLKTKYVRDCWHSMCDTTQRSFAPDSNWIPQILGTKRSGLHIKTTIYWSGSQPIQTRGQLRQPFQTHRPPLNLPEIFFKFHPKILLGLFWLSSIC